MFSMKALRLYLLFLLAQVGFCCSTPVFQYALERWEPDPFTLYIINDSKLDQQATIKIGHIENHFKPFYSQAALDLIIIEDKEDIPQSLDETISQSDTTTWPLAVLTFPTIDDLEYPVFQTPLNQLQIDNILQSPARSELANRLGAGQIAVWLLILSGNEEKDQAAKSALEAALKTLTPKLQKEINDRLGTLDMSENGGGELADGTLNLSIPTIKSSIIEVMHDDNRERLLIDMLTRKIPQLQNITEPIAYPIFGRGRVLWPMPAADIQHEHIESTLSFLNGSCSCQIKDQNPGYDLMLCVDWDSYISQKIVGETELPMLIEPTTNNLPTLRTNEPETPASIDLTPFLITVILGLALIAGAIIFLSKRTK